MDLSIITITFNAEKVIEKTILSVLNQTRTVYEYIFIDGGSTDKTNEIIERYAEVIQNKGIKYIHVSEKDRGISDAFNKGISRASGEYIGIINAGDELLPNANEELDKFTEQNAADIVYGNCIWMDEANGISYIRKPKGDLSRLYYDLVLIHPSTFVKRTAYTAYGMFNIDYKLCMDKELLLRMYVQGATFAYMDNELTIFRAGGASDQDVVKTVKEGIKLSNAYNRPKIITYPNALRKIIKHMLSSKVKKTPVYTLVKKAKKI